MRRARALFPKITVGLDVGDKVSVICEVDAQAEVVRRSSVRTTGAGVEAYFAGRERCRVVLEVGTHSPWLSRQLEALGHEVIVANPSAMYTKGHQRRRNDRMDAEFLARQGRADPKLLFPMRHRGEQAQQDLAWLRARDQLVSARTKLVNHVRGAVKSQGGRVERHSADAFGRLAVPEIPALLQPALAPVLETIVALTAQIHGYDRAVERMVKERYPEADHLQQPAGVGPITALAFVLLVDDPKRFERSRDVGAFFGLVPRLDDSSDDHPQLGITKAGDELGRRLLVSAGQYILGPNGPECDLRRFGQAMTQRGGKNAKKRAAVAVARKLAVLLHRLWVGQRSYDPDYLLRRRSA